MALNCRRHRVQCFLCRLALRRIIRTAPEDPVRNQQLENEKLSGETDEPMQPVFDGKRFSYPQGASLASHTDVLRWALTRKPARWPGNLINPPAEPVVQRVSDEGLRLTFVNHSTVLVQGGGVNLLTDPVYSSRVSPFSFAGPRRHRAPGVALDALPKIDAVLISHTHYDHMDIPTLQRIQARDNPLMVSPLGSAQILNRNGVSRTMEMTWWEQHSLNEQCQLTMVPAMHWTSRMPGKENTSLWGGYVLHLPGGAVYFAGDTGYASGQHFRQARQRLGPFRCALLPIGAYEPRWFMKPQHMNPAEAVQAFTDLEACYALGIHFGTFQLTDEAHDAPVAALQRALQASGLSGERFRTLENGGAWNVP